MAQSQQQDTVSHAPLPSCTHTLMYAPLTLICVCLLPHLDALPVGIRAPHVPQDRIHGTAVVKLLFKLVRVT